VSDRSDAGMRSWQRPCLIALLRNQPEETVLTACKMWPNPTLGPQTSDIRCGTLPGCPYVGCAAIAPS
jgi:hypothetical protein